MRVGPRCSLKAACVTIEISDKSIKTCCSNLSFQIGVPPAQYSRSPPNCSALIDDKGFGEKAHRLIANDALPLAEAATGKTARLNSIWVFLEFMAHRSIYEELLEFLCKQAERNTPILVGQVCHEKEDEHLVGHRHWMLLYFV